jgi:hypothetical protein
MPSFNLANNIANYLTPSRDTIQGIADRTGINLPTMPDLPYAGILGLLTGGAGNLGAYALKSLAGQAIPKAIDAVDPAINRGLKTGEQALKDDNLDYREMLLDRMFGQVPQNQIQTPVQANTSSTDFDNKFMQGNAPQPSSQGQPPAPPVQMPTYDFANGFTTGGLGMPTLTAPDFSNFGMPDISSFGASFDPNSYGQFDFQNDMPTYDFSFRNGGRV